MSRAMLFLMAVSTVLAASAFAGVPQHINYQGYLTNTDGNALDTTVAMTFKLYTDSTAGSLLWTEARPSITVTDGLFNVRFGQLTTLPDSVFNRAQVWLGITVGSNSEMTPRSRIVSVGYSYRVGTVDGATGGIITGKVNIGLDNTNSGEYAFVVGRDNRANGAYSVVAGGGGPHKRTPIPQAATGRSSAEDSVTLRPDGIPPSVVALGIHPVAMMHSWVEAKVIRLKLRTRRFVAAS